MKQTALLLCKNMTVALWLSSWDRLQPGHVIYDALQEAPEAELPEVWAGHQCVLNEAFNPNFTPAEVKDHMVETLRQQLNFAEMLSTSGVTPSIQVPSIKVPAWSPTWLVTTPISKQKETE